MGSSAEEGSNLKTGAPFIVFESFNLKVIMSVEFIKYEVYCLFKKC